MKRRKQDKAINKRFQLKKTALYIDLVNLQ